MPGTPQHKPQGHTFRQSTWHALRVAVQSARVGRALGVPGRAVLLLFVAALLHDVGKAFISKSIRNKPGMLDPRERRLMQAHTLLGARLVRWICCGSSRIAKTVRHHHERYDGRGYPSGLKGDEIPLFAQIVAVCDVYDALTSARPYKSAWEADEARAELERQAGRQFNPRIVQVFLNSGPGGPVSSPPRSPFATHH